MHLTGFIGIFCNVCTTSLSTFTYGQSLTLPCLKHFVNTNDILISDNDYLRQTLWQFIKRLYLLFCSILNLIISLKMSKNYTLCETCVCHTHILVHVKLAKNDIPGSSFVDRCQARFIFGRIFNKRYHMSIQFFCFFGHLLSKRFTM